MKEVGARLGFNLGFIDYIVLTDGTVVRNMHRLFNAPIPSEQQLETMFGAFSEEAPNYFEKATPSWSKYGIIPGMK